MPVYNYGIGGANGAFAMIIVTYPSGSSCTCTNSIGAKQITETQKIFYIGRNTVPFNCIVTATNGTDTKTRTVTVTYEGQSEYITILYRFYIFESGYGYIVESTETKQTYGIISHDENSITTSHSRQDTGMVALCTASTISTDNYSMFKVKTSEVTSIGTSATYSGRIVMNNSTFSASSTPTQMTMYTEMSVDSEEHVWSIDLSNVTGDKYFGVLGILDSVITDIWLE